MRVYPTAPSGTRMGKTPGLIKLWAPLEKNKASKNAKQGSLLRTWKADGSPAVFTNIKGR